MTDETKRMREFRVLLLRREKRGEEEKMRREAWQKRKKESHPRASCTADGLVSAVRLAAAIRRMQFRACCPVVLFNLLESALICSMDSYH